MASCCWYASATCAYDPSNQQIDASTLNRIRGAIDTMATQKISNECYYSIIDILCFQVGPLTNYYIVAGGHTPVARICLETCDAAYSYCKYNLPAVVPAGNLVQNGTALCENLLGQYGFNAVPVSINYKDTCYYGVESYSTIASNQGVCLNALHPSGAAALRPLLVLSAMSLLLVVCLI